MPPIPPRSSGWDRTAGSPIASTKTKEGLTVHCELDDNVYAKGRKVSDEEMEALNIIRDPFHGDWNYTLLPKKAKRSIRVRRKIDRLVS